MTTFQQLSKRLHKTGFYLSGLAEMAIPDEWYRRRRRMLLAELDRLTDGERAWVNARVAYYNKLKQPFTLPSSSERIGDFGRRGNSTAYFIDFKRLIRYFPAESRIHYLFGDITRVPEYPAFLKSRPIRPDDSNANSVLLKLNRVRHYYAVDDRIPFEEKKPMAVWRGKAQQRQRRDFLERYHDHPWCNVGDVHERSRGTPLHRPFMSIDSQLQYRFVVSIEGYDVATNLKWIMASNSLCLMRPPRFETWFMEGRLQPGVHYVPLKDDHSDLEEQMRYYTERPNEAKRIIGNAKAHVKQFRDEKMERLIGLLVIDRFLSLSGQ